MPGKEIFSLHCYRALRRRVACYRKCRKCAHSSSVTGGEDGASSTAMFPSVNRHGLLYSSMSGMGWGFESSIFPHGSVLRDIMYVSVVETKQICIQYTLIKHNQADMFPQGSPYIYVCNIRLNSIIDSKLVQSKTATPSGCLLCSVTVHTRVYICMLH